MACHLQYLVTLDPPLNEPDIVVKVTIVHPASAERLHFLRMRSYHPDVTDRDENFSGLQFTFTHRSRLGVVEDQIFRRNL